MSGYNECECGHSFYRHDMGHGCIECLCRGYRSVPCVGEHDWVGFGGPGDEWRECFACGLEQDA